MPISHPSPGEEKTEVTPEVKPEPEQPQEPTTTDDEPIQVQAQEEQPDEIRVEQKREVQQDRSSGQGRGVQQDRRGGRGLAEIELVTVPQQPPTATTNQRPQQSSPTFPARGIGRNHPPQPSPPEKATVTGWFKSFADF